VTEVRLFDVYQGDPIATGKKSLAYSVVYQSPDRTLTDEEVAAVRRTIIRQVKAELDGDLRV
jgi:phenylalanyl-tRNA synthetase beta chain